MDDFIHAQRISIISENLTAIRKIERTHANEVRTNKLLVEEVLALQKMLHAQTEAQHEILNYLSPFTYDGRSNNPARGTRRKLQQ